MKGVALKRRGRSPRRSHLITVWIAVLLAGSGASTPAAAEWPPWLERWLFNSAERTEQAIESFERGDAVDAVERLETVLRLAGDDPGVQYNAGTARLAAERGDAGPLLAAVAEGAGELATLASYNLGNARLTAGDFPAAIEAYQQTLRHDPTFQDAKYNLELARRRLEEQQDPQDQQQQQDQQPQQDQQQQQDQGQGQQHQQDQQDQQPQDERQDERQEEEQGGERPQESPLPQFRDLPDMSAAEAAAILEAIENTEREERRRAALDTAGQPHRGQKDW